MTPSTPAKIDVMDASDRAQKHRDPTNVRIPLDKLGVWPQNRGASSCSGFHVHEVAQDCMSNNINARRYVPVGIVKLPADLLAEVRQHNAELAQVDLLMPACRANEIEYALLSKAHIVHANKLANDGGRSLYNTGPRIAWQDGDDEGARSCCTAPPAQSTTARSTRTSLR